MTRVSESVKAFWRSFFIFRKIKRKEGIEMEQSYSLYHQQFEHDNCGIGAVVNSKGVKSHQTVENALKIVENL